MNCAHSSQFLCAPDTQHSDSDRAQLNRQPFYFDQLGARYANCSTLELIQGISWKKFLSLKLEIWKNISLERTLQRYKAGLQKLLN